MNMITITIMITISNLLKFPEEDKDKKRAEEGNMDTILACIVFFNIKKILKKELKDEKLKKRRLKKTYLFSRTLKF